MYLIRYSEFETRQVHKVRSDANFYSWVLDNNIGVFRFHNGRFERMVITQKERPGSRCLFFGAEWHEVLIDLGSSFASPDMADSE